MTPPPQGGRRYSLLHYILTITVVFLAVILAITKPNLLTSFPGNFPTFSPKATDSPQKSAASLPFCVLWMAPFLSGGGYSSEAWSYIDSLSDHLEGSPNFSIAIEQHGDLQSVEFWDGLPEDTKALAVRLYGKVGCENKRTVVVCHSEPGAWHPPLFQTTPCPPDGYGKYMAVIGRTMFESDRVNVEHVKRCNRMDAVWVPTDFHVGSFVSSGVDESKVVKVVQPVDVEFFNPSKYEPLDLASLGKLVLGSEKGGDTKDEEFVFLSVFKWEYRKGWDVLLRAFLGEFSASAGVSLYLLTNPYHSDRNFGSKILDFVRTSGLQRPSNGWARVYVISKHIAQVDLPGMYKAADAFVLPSRGEGWGRPVVEAMAMSLPVISTNWSGPTEYMTDENSYPLPAYKMSEVLDGPFKGHLWAEPSVDQLSILMRRVVERPEESTAKGRKAREDMIARFAPGVVAKIVADEFQHLVKKMQ
ncbi:hypothetical protein MLD38_038035 [Melastoma candidum]|uniref:Uncharacterized protein n=1 Tax=Melastoma candidum TaxID=119954 RepID=A0ACB9KXR2_9MYRT|nr:hypothetical protein MLD38_038035 [Melastoma candidum]